MLRPYSQRHRPTRSRHATFENEALPLNRFALQAAVANQRIIVEPLRMSVRVRADAQMLQQLLLNVLTNALDAIENGGEVRIAVGITRAPHGSLGQE